MSNLPPEEMTAQARKLTPTERLHEVTMAAMHRAPAPPESSVTISRNAKGVAQFEVVVRAENVNEAETMARQIFGQLCTTYPYPTTNGGEAA